MAGVASFARRTASLRTSFRSSISRSSPFQSRSQLPQPPLPSRSSTTRYQSSFRRESLALFTMLPIHSAIASSRLVSKIPNEPCSCAESKVVSLGRRISDLPMGLIYTTSISLLKKLPDKFWEVLPSRRMIQRPDKRLPQKNFKPKENEVIVESMKLQEHPK